MTDTANTATRHEAFVEFALNLREHGAVSVRDGSLEVRWANPPAPEPVEDDPVRALNQAERRELEHLRDEQERWEEVP